MIKCKVKQGYTYDGFYRDVDRGRVRRIFKAGEEVEVSETAFNRCAGALIPVDVAAADAKAAKDAESKVKAEIEAKAKAEAEAAAKAEEEAKAEAAKAAKAGK